MKKELLIKKRNKLQSMGLDDFHQIKSSKFIKLISFELQVLKEFYDLQQLLEVVNEIFNLNITYSTFYKYSNSIHTNYVEPKKYLPLNKINESKSYIESSSTKKSLDNKRKEIVENSKVDSLVNLPSVDISNLGFKDVDTSRYKK